jgi:hypothetical protein
VLAAAGEAPLTAYTTGNDNAFVLVQRQAPIAPHAMGLSETLNIVNHTGLPKWLSIDERRGMRLAIANALQNKNVTWTEPVKTYMQMQLTLEDRQPRKNSSERLVNVTIYYPNVTYIYCSNCYCCLPWHVLLCRSITVAVQ